ncbi:hypothetical protein A9978_31645 [Pseudomonas sp. UMC65]|uniref:hypothetical protein n=1 Tax=unclassified Pseudomonas TaxID=196821 RepID=UPI00160360FA|nr:MULTISPECIES: hypothetical protein [unclassified Pseudomonas]MBB1617013.1 hypothetical protein [Pseudomonas sp. UMC65]MBB1623100.1 hypothetical protein [Pseudomonas sp. UME65]
MEAGERKCPHCAEQIKQDAVKCKHCGSDATNPPKSKDQKARSTQKIALFWLVIVIGAYTVISKNIGSNSAEPTEEEYSHQAIDLCWKNVDDKLADLDARRAMRDACIRMTKAHGQKYGSTAGIRTE